MKPILHTLRTSSSGKGYHYYSAFAECPRRANLRAEQILEDGSKLDTSGAMAVGSLFHGYMEERYRRAMRVGAPNEEVLPVGADDVQFVTEMADAQLDLETLAEAQRLYRAYVSRFGAIGKELGDPRAVEAVYHASGKSAKQLYSVDTFDARIDLITWIDRPTAEALNLGGTLLGPYTVTEGYWAIDHKTGARQDSNLVEKRMYHQQYVGYMLAAQQLFPAEPLQGMISNEVIKTKEPKFFRIVIPFPGEAEQKSFRAFMSGCDTIRKHKVLGDWARADAETCFPPGRTCPFFTNGMCSRGAR